MAHEDLVPDTLNPAVAEKAREAVLMATTVLGMSRTDVVDTYCHLARQYGVTVGTELDSSKVWLKMYRGVVSAMQLDTGVERVEVGQDEARRMRTQLSDDAGLGIVREHADKGKLKKVGSAMLAARRIEKNANRGKTGDALDSWESALGEIVVNIAVGGATLEDAIKATKLRHADMKEVGQFVPEAHLTQGEGPATLIENGTAPITSSKARVVTLKAPSGKQVGDDMGDTLDEEDWGGSYFALDREDDKEEDPAREAADGFDPKKAAVAEALHTLLADKLPDRDYAGFRYLMKNATDYLDRKLSPPRRGEGVETHEMRSGDIFGAGERTRPEFIEGLQAAVGYSGHKDTAGARKFLSRLEEKIQEWTGELESMLDKGIQPPLTEKAQERMNMSIQDLSCLGKSRGNTAQI